MEEDAAKRVRAHIYRLSRYYTLDYLKAKVSKWKKSHVKMDKDGCLISDTTKSKGYAKIKLGGQEFEAKRSDTIPNPINSKVRKEIDQRKCKFPSKWLAPAYTVIAYVDGVITRNYKEIPEDWVASHLCHKGEVGCVLALVDPEKTHISFEPQKVNMERKNNRCGQLTTCLCCNKPTPISCPGHKDSSDKTWPKCKIFLK